MRWSLTPIVRHLVRRDEAYIQMMPGWERIVPVPATAVGWVFVDVPSGGGQLMDSTYVYLPIEGE
jgi:hypothetical protein